MADRPYISVIHVHDGVWVPRAEHAEIVEWLKSMLEEVIEVAAQYMDTGRGDLDGVLERTASELYKTWAYK